MPSNSSSYRNRPRGKQQRQDEPGDAVVIALTAQVIICIILLLAANISKKMDETAYRSVKDQYNIMVTDETENGRAYAYLTDEESGVAGFFGALENFISSLFDRFSSPPVAVAPPGAAASSESAVESDIDEPQASAEESSAANFSYDYLGTEDAAYISENAQGQGGWLPVDITDKDEEMLAAPKGSVLSPVVLSGKILPPVTGLITSEFAYRYHPITETTDFHTGMDIAAEEGRDILAALPGEVVEVGESAIYGKYIVLQHATNLQTYYAHCSEIIASEGMAVRQGERIAKVGQTGTATGPHLHFSVIVEGKFTDPYWVLSDHIKLVE